MSVPIHNLTPVYATNTTVHPLTTVSYRSDSHTVCGHSRRHGRELCMAASNAGERGRNGALLLYPYIPTNPTACWVRAGRQQQQQQQQEPATTMLAASAPVRSMTKTKLALPETHLYTKQATETCLRPCLQTTTSKHISPLILGLPPCYCSLLLLSSRSIPLHEKNYRPT